MTRIKKILKQIISEEDVVNEGNLDFFKQKSFFKKNPNVWIHATNSEEIINKIQNGDDFIGKKEDINKFNVPEKGNFATFVNQHAPNFKKGDFFHGYEGSKFIITTELPDSAFQPNWNSRNYDNLKDSQNVAVLKPEYRSAKNFKLWKRNEKNQYEMIK